MPSLPREFCANPEYRTPPVAHEVPIATVRDNMYVLTDGSFAGVWRVAGFQNDLASNSEIVTAYERLQAVLNSVPTGMQIKHLHRVHHNYLDLLAQHEATMDGDIPLARFVDWEQTQTYREAMLAGDLFRSDNYIVLTYNPRVSWWKMPGPWTSLVSAFLEDSQVSGEMRQQSQARFTEAKSKFVAAIQPVVSQMESAKLEPERLRDKELYSLAWQMLNPRLSLKEMCPEIRVPDPDDQYAGAFATGKGKTAAQKNPAVTIVAPISEREQLCKSHWVVRKKCVEIHDQLYTGITMSMLPSAVHAGLGYGLASLGFEYTVAIDAVMLEKQAELDRQWRVAKSGKNRASATFVDGATPDPLKMEQAQEMEQGYLELGAANRNAFAMRLTIVFAAESERELEERRSEVVSRLREMNQMDAKDAYFNAPEVIKASWPFSVMSEANMRKAVTHHVAALMPMVSTWEGSKRPVALFMNPMRRLIKHDPFPQNLPSKNRTVCGATGEGKSFSIQLADIQPHAARKNTEILLVESGESFRFTVEALGGKFLKLGPTCEFTLNPFDLPDGFSDMDAGVQEQELGYKYIFVKNLIMTMARVTDVDSQIAAEAIVNALCPKLYQTVKNPRFRDFYALLRSYTNERDPDAQRLVGKLLTRLAQFVVTPEGVAGPYAKYFDCYTTMKVEVPIFDFDLTDVKGDKALLDAMSMVLIMGFIYNRLMRRDGVERLIVIDEAWALLKEGAQGGTSPALDAIERFWREGRKYGGGATMITQQWSDMTKDKIGSTVIAQSTIWYFLRHESTRTETEAFKSTDFSEAKIDRIYKMQTKYGDYSELMVREGSNWGIMRLPGRRLKYWLATTEPNDYQARVKYMKTYSRYGFDLPTILAILAEDYPAGVLHPQGPQMKEDEAVRFGQWWKSKFDEFSESIRSGRGIPADFKMH